MPAYPDNVCTSRPGRHSTRASSRHPVLYLHDGQNLFDGATHYVPGQDWRVAQTAGALIREQAIEPAIVVGIYNAGRERVGPILRYLYPSR